MFNSVNNDSNPQFAAIHAKPRKNTQRVFGPKKQIAHVSGTDKTEFKKLLTAKKTASPETKQDAVKAVRDFTANVFKKLSEQKN